MDNNMNEIKADVGFLRGQNKLSARIISFWESFFGIFDRNNGNTKEKK